MPVIGSDSEILKEYVNSYELGRIYLGSTKVQDGLNEYLFIRGGTVTTSGDYKIHTFSTVGTSSLYIDELASIPANNVIEYFVIGGGGAGEAKRSGVGGGAGGLVTGSRTITPSDLGAFEVIVGAGGVGTNAYNLPTSGSSSRISGSFTYLAYGGGTGGNSQNYPGQYSLNGGSGAGGGSTLDATQGNNGGTLYVPGGGGAGQAGQNGTNSVPLVAGDGGDGIYLSIFSQYVCGGGAGGGIAGDANNRTPGTGGLNGGGSGGNYTGTSSDRSGKNGTTYGSAGGGIGDNAGDPYVTECVSGNGYQGIVAIRYKYQN